MKHLICIATTCQPPRRNAVCRVLAAFVMLVTTAMVVPTLPAQNLEKPGKPLNLRAYYGENIIALHWEKSVLGGPITEYEYRLKEQSVDVTNDTAKPTVTIASAGSFPTRDEFEVTITFSDDVTGFQASAVTVGKGGASNLSGSGTTYELTVTPEADHAGALTLSVSADAAVDTNGVGNASASQTFDVDTKVPAFRAAAVTGNTLTLTYDENLDGTSTPAADAFWVTAGASGSLETVALADSDPVTLAGRTVTLTLASAVAAGAMVEVSYRVPQSGSKLQDMLGNPAAALTAKNVTNETAKPAVEITSGANHPTNAAFAVTITFSEAVTGFQATEVAVTKGTAAPSFTSQTAMVYEIQVTPDTDYDGEVTVTVSADAADGNGIGNAAAKATFEADTKGPVPDGATVAGNTLTLTYDEDLDSTSTPAADAFAVTAGASSAALTTVALASSNPVTVAGRTVTLKLASAVLTNDIVTVSYTVPGSGSKLRDTLGNAAVAHTPKPFGSWMNVIGSGPETVSYWPAQAFTYYSTYTFQVRAINAAGASDSIQSSQRDTEGLCAKADRRGCRFGWRKSPALFP